ncbi:MAG: hypothetical protein QXK24_06885 [Ignisphaera sp.]
MSEFIWLNKDLTLPIFWKTNRTEKKYYTFAGTPTRCDITIDVKDIGYWFLWWKVPRGFFPPSVGITIYVNGYPVKTYTSPLGVSCFTDTFSVLEYVSSGINWFQVELWSSIPLPYSWYMIFDCILTVDVEATLEKIEYPPQYIPDIGAFFGNIGNVMVNVINVVITLLVLYIVIDMIRLMEKVVGV